MDAVERDRRIIDDLIVYFLAECSFRLVITPVPRQRHRLDQAACAYSASRCWNARSGDACNPGPAARATTATLLSDHGAHAALDLQPFCACAIDAWFVARTGYTGEDGFELMLPVADATRSGAN